MSTVNADVEITRIAVVVHFWIGPFFIAPIEPVVRRGNTGGGHPLCSCGRGHPPFDWH